MAKKRETEGLNIGLPEANFWSKTSNRFYAHIKFGELSRRREYLTTDSTPQKFSVPDVNCLTLTEGNSYRRLINNSNDTGYEM